MFLISLYSEPFVDLQLGNKKFNSISFKYFNTLTSIKVLFVHLIKGGEKEKKEFCK